MNKHRQFLIWACILIFSGVYRLLWGPVEDYLFRLSPISIWMLPERAWFSILATIAASILAWFAALIVGGVLGVFSAAGQLASQREGTVWKGWHGLATVIRKIFMSLYVIPLVLTLSVIATVLLKLELKGSINPAAVGVLLIISSGVALAGQRIFIALDEAVTTASSDDMVLASSLYLGSESPRFKRWESLKRLCREAKFLIACRISLLTQAIEQAFHLSVVGVVILETTSGLYLYEKIVPQEAGVLPWGGGIGRVIIDGQNATNPELVAGAVWLILLIDSLLALGIRELIYKKWVYPYRSKQE